MDVIGRRCCSRGSFVTKRLGALLHEMDPLRAGRLVFQARELHAGNHEGVSIACLGIAPGRRWRLFKGQLQPPMRPASRLSHMRWFPRRTVPARIYRRKRRRQYGPRDCSIAIRLDPTLRLKVKRTLREKRERIPRGLSFSLPRPAPRLSLARSARAKCA
jgi:hypothetical protein